VGDAGGFGNDGRVVPPQDLVVIASWHPLTVMANRKPQELP
jgi:hypothetical protein